MHSNWAELYIVWYSLSPTQPHQGDVGVMALGGFLGGSLNRQSASFIIMQNEVDDLEKELGIHSSSLVKQEKRGRRRELESLFTGINYDMYSGSRGSRPERGSRNKGSQSCP